jgi:hypothetical protein
VRDLSARPFRAAALAPLIAPVVLTLMATVLESALKIGALDTFAKTLLLVLAVSYGYMWMAALPIILILRPWIRWSWPRLIALGALLGALPWLVALIASAVGSARELPWNDTAGSLWRQITQGERVWPIFAVTGACVAGAFCVLQARFLGTVASNDNRPR